jgi:hypothetical protein
MIVLKFSAAAWGVITAIGLLLGFPVDTPLICMVVNLTGVYVLQELKGEK